jgi:hypothetical protein
MRTDIAERIGIWQMAFNVVRMELAPKELRTILSEMKEVEGVAQLQSYTALAKQVMDADRTAAIVAASLSQGARPAAVLNFDDDVEEG